MNITAKSSHLTAEFTPDEWPQVRELLDFAVAHVEQLNVDFFEEMKKHPHLTPTQVQALSANSLGNLLDTPHQ